MMLAPAGDAKQIFGKTNPRCALATERQVFGENTDTTVGGL
jgi:hypothetical protein